MIQEKWVKGETSKLAGQKVTITKGSMKGCEYHIEDWVYNVSGKRWADNNVIAVLNYARRTYEENLPGIGDEGEDDVYYGKIGGLGYLVHVSEIA